LGVRRLPLALGAVLAAALAAPAAAVAQGDTTTTTVGCTPPSVLVGASTSCSATVQDTTPDGSTPSGALGFVSDTAGGEFQDPEHLGTSTSSCTLNAVGEEHAASCRLIYIPGAFGSGVHKITVSYPGDDLHEQSSGSGNVNVARHGTTTAIACAPGSLTLGAGTSSCVVTVTDTSDLANAPTGGIALSSAGGSFGPGCEGLAPAGTNQANCTAAYTPAIPGASSLTGTYAGDSAHETSAGTAQVSVAAAPGSATPAKKKCKKKRGRSASAAKKKCKKKKRR
jgi:hypothetical protein